MTPKPDNTPETLNASLAAPAGSVVICPKCGRPDGRYLWDVPLYEAYGNTDHQRMFRKFACESCEEVWLERIRQNTKDQP